MYCPFNKKSKAVELSHLDRFYFNSGNVYFMISADNSKLFKWIGQGSNQQERSFEPQLLFSGKEIVEVSQGEEPEELWQEIFGQSTRPDFIKQYERKSTDIKPIEPRLFLVTNETGYFHVEEIFDFVQEDLDHGDVMILDAFDTIFVWVGRESNAFEKKKSMDLCQFYINMCVNNGRENSVNIVDEMEGFESAYFKSFFPDWDDNNFVKVSDKLKEISDSVFKVAEESKSTGLYHSFPESEFDGYEHPRDHKYTRQQMNEEWPKGVKRSRCELYLEDAEFESIFKMTKDEFYQLKDWKRLRYKKENKLF